MLNHLLAGIVALGSLVLFLSGFFFPEVQRKPDLAWSGVALLYALLLFAEGDRTSGGAVLGHMASVSLILWFGWQTLQQRRQFAPVEDQTAVPDSMEALTPFVKEGWGRIMVAYGEASRWIQEQLGKDDAGIAPEALTQQSQDWDDTSTDSEPDDLAVAVAPEPTLESPPPEVDSTTAAVASSDPVQLESAPPPMTEESSECLAASSEPEQVSNEPASPVISHEASEVEIKDTATAGHQESAPSPPVLVETFSPEIEPASPVTEVEDTPASESPAASTQPEDDGSWPPPEPEV
jgi:Ycf66 protein N-terminus